MTDEQIVVKRGPGRPRKIVAAATEREPLRESNKPKMRAKPNWETMDPNEDSDNPDRLHIPRAQIPEGYDAQWVTDSVLGKPEPGRRQIFERTGWTPVHQEDFEGQFDGKFMPKGTESEITVGGSVLMMRPMKLTIEAKRKERRAALEQVAVKEQSLKGGDVGTSLDSTHPTAVRSNRITKTVERISIPEE